MYVGRPTEAILKYYTSYWVISILRHYQYNFVISWWRCTRFVDRNDESTIMMFPSFVVAVYDSDDESLSSHKAKLNSTFFDSVYGSISLEPALVQIIDTPEFQRLAHIAQLGPCSLVFRGATHTRFCHSIGVSNLAGEMLKSSE